MPRRSYFFILTAGLLCAFVWTSCASSKRAPSQEERSQPAEGSTPDTALPSASDKRPVIVTFGDSLTAGVAGKSYPENLQELLDDSHLLFRVENQGVSGDTTTDGLARIENVTGEHPALVVLEFGGNDGLRGIPVEATRQNLAEMIEKLRDAEVPIVLLGITLPPNYGPDYVQPFTAMFPELAKKYRLPYLPFLLAHVYRDRTLMQPDGIHPNGDGNKIVALDVLQLIRPLLGKHKAKK